MRTTPDPLTRLLINEIRSEMALAGLSYSDLAESTGKSYSGISRRFTGRIEFTVRDMVEVCNVIGVDFQDITQRATVRAAS